MKRSRIVVLLAVFVLAGFAAWYYSRKPSQNANTITIYYTKIDGATEVPWTITSAAKDAPLYAATQAVAGPPSDVQAIRFPAGTRVRSVNVTGSTATVDLSKDVEAQSGGAGSEAASFKALTWTMTALPGITSVAIRVEGQPVKTLPEGHLELDEPLHRSDF